MASRNSKHDTDGSWEQHSAAILIKGSKEENGAEWMNKNGKYSSIPIIRGNVDRGHLG
jgi:hypothetical protein